MLGSPVEEAAATLDRDAALISLGVDDRDSRRADRKVIDVRAAARHAPVVDQEDTVTGRPALELASELDLPFSTARPVALVGGLARKGQNDAAERPVLPANPCVATVAAAFVLALRARAREGLGRRGLASKTPSMAVVWVPHRLFTNRQAPGADGTRVGSAQIQAARTGRHPRRIDASGTAPEMNAQWSSHRRSLRLGGKDAAPAPKDRMTKPPKSDTTELVDALLDCVAPITQILDHMARSPSSADIDASVSVFKELLNEVLGPVSGRIGAKALRTAAEVLDTVTDTIAEELLLVPQPSQL